MPIRHFNAATEGLNRLGLRELLQRYADDQWVAAHMTEEQAAESVLDCFKRAVAQELQLLELRCRRQSPKKPKPKAHRRSRRVRGQE